MHKNIYFLSDFHFIVDDAASHEREKLVVLFLDSIRGDAKKIYILGDIFDFWFEYKTVIPKGFTRFYACLHRLLDAGVEIEIFTGNHDMWQFGFFENEFNIKVHFDLIQVTHNNKVFLLGHGDGKGPGDMGYKVLKKMFNNTLCKKLFGIIHPTIGNRLAYFWSKKSRLSQVDKPHNTFMGLEHEWLYQYCQKRAATEVVHYYVFGHRHLPLHLPINQHSYYINLGDWITHNSYARWDGERMTVSSFSK